MKLDELILASEGKFLSVKFRKKDGTLRTMLCRLGVTKHLADPQGTNECTVDFERFIVVYDLNSQGFRSIKRDSIVSVSIDGVTFQENQV